MPSPTRDTSERELHAFNQRLRQQPFVQQWLAQRGKVDRGAGIQLSEQEREQFTQMLRANGVNVPSGMKVDGAGNFNQKNHLWRNVGIGAAVGGAAMTGLGAAGIGPMAGMFGGGAAAGGGALNTSIGGAAGMASSPVPAVIGATGGAGLGPGLTAPLGTIAAGGAAGAGGIGSRLAGAGRGALQNLTSPEGMLSLAPLIASLASGGFGGGGGNDGNNNEFLERAYADAKRNNAMAETRYRRTDPLHQAVSQLAFDRMPISSRRNAPMLPIPLPPQE